LCLFITNYKHKSKHITELSLSPIKQETAADHQHCATKNMKTGRYSIFKNKKKTIKKKKQILVNLATEMRRTQFAAASMMANTVMQ